MINAQDVWSVVHTTTGDFEAHDVTEVDIDGALFTLHITRSYVPFDCETTGVTLHLGGLGVDLPITRVKIRAGGTFTAIHTVQFCTLSRVPCDEQRRRLGMNR